MKFGVVVIGRNEGDRLRKSLESVVGRTDAVVYVDSGSMDDSVGVARSLGAVVVRLDMAHPCTAARARNAGFLRLSELVPDLAYVQFVDGDCEVVHGWLEEAARFLDGHPEVGAVCGRLRERFPERSVYNMLCDAEWNAPVGEAKACGGITMLRCDALTQAGKYREDLIAGEEPELCIRLRAAGWKVWRIGVEMALHDAAMTRFGQWWKRSKRSGYAFAQGVHLHGTSPERAGVRQSLSAWVWGLAIPAFAIGLSVWWGAWAWAVLLLYPAKVTQIALRGTRSARENWWRAFFLMLGKFPEAAGQLYFLYNQLAQKTARLIEYK